MFYMSEENQENRQSRKRQFSDSQNGLPAPKRKRLFPDTNGEDNNSNWEWVAGEKERTEPRNTTDEVANSTSKDTSTHQECRIGRLHTMSDKLFMFKSKIYMEKPQKVA